MFNFGGVLMIFSNKLNKHSTVIFHRNRLGTAKRQSCLPFNLLYIKNTPKCIGHTINKYMLTIQIYINDIYV